jgi:hypothetical protein
MVINTGRDRYMDQPRVARSEKEMVNWVPKYKVIVDAQDYKFESSRISRVIPL